MPQETALQIGSTFRVIEPGNVPPIGARIVIHQNLSQTGNAEEVEVTKHEWRLMPPDPDPDADTEAYLSLHIHTRPLR